MTDKILEFVRTVWKDPTVQSAHTTLNFLSGVSGCFWLVSWLVGQWALLIHDVLIAELADCFAILYNGVLAVAFACVMALSVNGAGLQNLLWHQALGFIFVYFVLTAAYADPATKEIDDYSILGYLAGLGAYLAFTLHPSIVDEPWIKSAYGVVVWMAKGWVGKLLTAYAAYKMIHIAVRKLRERFNPNPPIRIRQ